jgi:hypothetical protein
VCGEEWSEIQQKIEFFSCGPNLTSDRNHNRVLHLTVKQPSETFSSYYELSPTTSPPPLDENSGEFYNRLSHFHYPVVHFASVFISNRQTDYNSRISETKTITANLQLSPHIRM